jgi:hypothetical protein
LRTPVYAEWTPNGEIAGRLVDRHPTTAASISVATRFFKIGLRRDNSCSASSPPLS